MRTVDSHVIAEVERELSAKRRVVGVGLATQFSRADVRREAFERFLVHHHDTLRKAAPELDPRFQPTIDTMLLHFFLVGVMCGRKTATP